MKKKRKRKKILKKRKRQRGRKRDTEGITERQREPAIKASGYRPTKRTFFPYASGLGAKS